MNINKVIAMQSREGKPWRNQYILKAEEGDYLQSYDSIVALKTTDGRVILHPEYYNYSATTAKVRDAFLGITREQFTQNMKDGKYILQSLGK